MVESVMFVIISDSYCFTGKGRGVPFSRLFPAICTPCRISLIIIIGCLGVQIGCVCSGCSGGYSLIRLVGVCGRVKGIVCHYFTGGLCVVVYRLLRGLGWPCGGSVVERCVAW